MRRNFNRVDEPVDGDLVTCDSTSTGGLHVGVWLRQGIYHAYRATGKIGGDTVITSHAVFSNSFKNIRYYRWRQ